MAVLRTRKLATHVIASPATDETLYTTPAGVRAVLRDLRVCNPNGSTATATTVYLVLSGGSSGFWIYRAAIPATTVDSLTSDAVLEPGDSIHCSSDLAGITLWASGAELLIP